MSQTPRVLIVEDDPLVSEMIYGILQDLAYHVVGEAIDGNEAVSMTHTFQPDVILMDVEMPLMNGIEAAQIISQQSPTPIVMLTAFDSLDLVKQASLAGVGAYLQKPPNVREVERAIIIAMARHQDMMTLRHLNKQLQTALEQVKFLKGLLPICANCKKIRNDQGYWQQVEVYLQEHADVEFSHGICPNCINILYPEYSSDNK